MYRLAMELDLFPRGNMQTDANAIRIPASQHSKITADLIALIDSYPTEQQSDLKAALHIGQPQGTCAYTGIPSCGSAGRHRMLPD